MIKINLIFLFYLPAVLTDPKDGKDSQAQAQNAAGYHY